MSGEGQMWQSIAIFSFGVILVLILLFIVFRLPNPTPFQYTTLRIILAMACSAIATALTGFLEVQVEVPIIIKAGGPLAVFIVAYIVAPAAIGGAHEREPLVGKDLAVGDRIQVRGTGQRDIQIPDKGIIGWGPDTAKYRGQIGEITQMQTLFDKVAVFRIFPRSFLKSLMQFACLLGLLMTRTKVHQERA
jgi:hypothetical protein